MRKEKRADDRQEGGRHYTDMKVTPWQVMEADFTKQEFEGFLKGCALKRILRSRAKGGVEDIKKAKHELEKLIEVMEE